MRAQRYSAFRVIDAEFADRGIVGLELAINYVQSGHFIFAIKLLEELNPLIDRMQAKEIVRTIGYIRDVIDDDAPPLPLRRLQ